MALNIDMIKAKIGDELGLTDHDLAELYGVAESKLNAHLGSLEKSEKALYDRMLSDVDAARTSYRKFAVSDEQIAAIRALLSKHIFRPFASLVQADGNLGWRLSRDDAEFVAFRTSDIVGLDLEASELVRKRLNRVVLWAEESAPKLTKELLDRLADITFYLLELSSVV